MEQEQNAYKDEMFRNNAVMYHNQSWVTLCQQNCGAISAVINALFN